MKLVRRHPKYNLCGFTDHILGCEAMLVVLAITEYGEESWIVDMQHPGSKRWISPTFVAMMFDKIG